MLTTVLLARAARLQTNFGAIFHRVQVCNLCLLYKSSKTRKTTIYMFNLRSTYFCFASVNPYTMPKARIPRSRSLYLNIEVYSIVAIILNHTLNRNRCPVILTRDSRQPIKTQRFYVVWRSLSLQLYSKLDNSASERNRSDGNCIIISCK